MEKVNHVFLGHALIDAIKRNDCAAASTLIRSGADVWLEEDGCNALNWAIDMKNFDAIKGILFSGQPPKKADLNLSLMNLDSLIFITDYNEMSLLIGENVIGKPIRIFKIGFRYECLKNSLKLFKYWIKKVRDINEINKMGHAGVDMCASYGQFQALKILIEEGANIHKCDNEGHNALYHAVIGSADKRTIKLLLDKGLRLNKEEMSGKVEKALYKKAAINRLIRAYNGGSNNEKLDENSKTACDLTKNIDTRYILGSDKACCKK
jgi:ankyrin repeat protein